MIGQVYRLLLDIECERVPASLGELTPEKGGHSASHDANYLNEMAALRL
jgi:hypothetical protein